MSDGNIVSQNVETQTVIDNNITIQVTQATQEQITIGVPGPRGPPGQTGPTGATTLSCTAGAALSGNRMVTYDANSAVVYASSADATAHAVLGMTLGAALLGAAVSVQTYGEVVEPSWSWIPLEPVYLSTNGTLSQTAPVTGYCVRLGFALDARTLMLAVEPALKLA
jgi:hypothetical protein